MNLFAKYYYSNDYKEILKWLWFLNILTMCHYNKWDTMWKKLLQNLNLDIPIYLINEKEFFHLLKKILYNYISTTQTIFFLNISLFKK